MGSKLSYFPSSIAKDYCKLATIGLGNTSGGYSTTGTTTNATDRDYSTYYEVDTPQQTGQGQIADIKIDFPQILYNGLLAHYVFFRCQNYTATAGSATYTISYGINSVFETTLKTGTLNLNEEIYLEESYTIPRAGFLRYRITQNAGDGQRKAMVALYESHLMAVGV